MEAGEFKEKIDAISPASLTRQLVQCFNHCSDVTRYSQSLNNEIRDLLSVFDQFTTRTNEERVILTSRYKQAIGCLIEVKEYIDIILASKESKQSSLLDTIHTIRTLMDKCLISQKIELMDVQIGQMIKPEYHTTEGTTPVEHELPQGTVIAVLRHGYIQKDGEKEIVIRPAVVQVSSGVSNDIDNN